MSLQNALQALKRKDFASARAYMAQENMAAFGIQHFLIKGLSELALKDWPAGFNTFKAATERFPDQETFWLNRGLVEENLGLTDAAIASQEKCLAVNPAQADACGNLSNLYRKAKRYADAENMARRALAGGAVESDALNCLALALIKQSKFDAAEVALKQAHLSDPQNAAVLGNLANLETEFLRFDEAYTFFAAARAIRDNPVFRHDEALARLLAGNYEEGWKLFESRFELPGPLRLHPACPRWQGENLKGKKLLIIAEQGFGDVIQFSRYQKFLNDPGLIWAVPKPLVRLLSLNLRGAVFAETDPLPACDYYVPMMSLPLATKQYAPLTIGKPLAAPQFPQLPPGKRAKKIGLVWAGSRTHERDHERSIPLKLFEPILKKIDTDFYAPFTGDTLNDIGTLPVIKLDRLISDFADTAALLKQMNCLIAVDTAAAHLAGALGVKTFLLLPYCSDWRWGATDETTPWYPSLTLLRQPKHGDWQSVLDLLERRLGETA